MLLFGYRLRFGSTVRFENVTIWHCCFKIVYAHKTAAGNFGAPSQVKILKYAF